MHLRACLLYECYWPLCITKFDHPCSYSPRIGQYLRNLYATERRTMECYMEFITRVMMYANCKFRKISLPFFFKHITNDK